MPADKGGKNAEPQKSLINRYGDGWGVPPGLEIGARLSTKEQNGAEKSYIHVQSDAERLVKRGRWSPK